MEYDKRQKLKKGQFRALLSVLRPEDTILELGANIGYLTQLMSESSKQIDAYEPVYETFIELNHNTPQPNIKCHPVGVWEGNINIRIDYYGPVKEGTDNNQFYSVYKKSSRWKRLGKMDLWTWINVNIHKSNILVMDIEGTERKLVPKILDSIYQHFDVICFEYHSTNRRELDHFYELHQQLSNIYEFNKFSRKPTIHQPSGNHYFYNGTSVLTYSKRELEPSRRA